jgi:hypothetical protein
MWLWLSTTDESPPTGCNNFERIDFRRRSVVRVYLPDSIPWALMTLLAAGLWRTSRSAFAASIDVELALMPPVNVT